ncbi:MAG: sensor histidine kinase [Chitinophagaceae bacterium]|nr:sensor histidine kinase [Oligoflexus sp.]
MKLTQFIHENHKIIIDDWVAFARTLHPWSEGMNKKSLSDHADELLTAIVTDMKSPQTLKEQSEKSKGNVIDGALAIIGQKHASDRLQTGISLDQLVSEFRALRASVLRLWEKAQGDDQGEITRFNEAIDETLAKSTTRYAETVNTTREQFLGILGHDLRNPIGAIIMGATLMADSSDHENVEVAASIRSSAERMSRMVNDLLDLTRTRLGAGIPVTLNDMELNAVCRQSISELRATHPETEFCFDTHEDIYGRWDTDRLSQVVSNLVANAIQYGSLGDPITIQTSTNDGHAILKVHNEGEPIPEHILHTIFAPMTRHQSAGQKVDTNVTGLGLGLYIASEIVTAHCGRIYVKSNEAIGTTFTVTLPLLPA